MQRKAYRYFLAKSRRSPPEEAEDFASWAVIKLIEGRKATLGQLYIDYLRLSIGDPRNKFERWKRSDIQAEEMPAPQRENTYFSGASLDGFDRAVVFLTYKWGFERSEIAECFGVSQGWISQVLSRAQELVRKRIWEG